MASDLDDLADPERRLCEVLAAYFEAVKAGQAPEREAWLARYPDLAGQLTAFLEQQDRLLRVTEPLRTIAEASGHLGSQADRGPSRAPNGNGGPCHGGHRGPRLRRLRADRRDRPRRDGRRLPARAAQPQPPRGAEDAPRRAAGRRGRRCAGFASRPRRSPTSTTRTSCRSTRSASTRASATSR